MERAEMLLERRCVTRLVS